MSEALVEQINTGPDIFKINVPLPNNPLRNLNCYVLKTPHKNLIIDTGFNLKESKQALLEGLAKLEIDMAETEVYATHMHADHTGLIGEIIRDDTIVYMSKQDYEYMVMYMTGGWRIVGTHMGQEGFSQDEIEENRRFNPSRNYATGKMFDPHLVRDGDNIRIGPYVLTVISVPGHTPGNTCLYMENEKILFTGDHILFNITPNIVIWPGMEDSLGSYLKSLEKVRKLDIRLALPAHRTNDMDIYKRIDQLIDHHEKRFEEVERILKEHQGISAYDVASHMKWSMRGKDWSEFPAHQKWFAVGEARAHLDYLVLRGRVEEIIVNGIYLYY